MDDDDAAVQNETLQTAEGLNANSEFDNIDPMDTSPTLDKNENNSFKVDESDADADTAAGGSTTSMTGSGNEFDNTDTVLDENTSENMITDSSMNGNMDVPGLVSGAEEARQAIEMLRGDDVAGRVAAVQRLESIATVLGERRTREELVPFLTESVDDEDEVLFALADALGKLIPFVGGKQFAHVILQPLELLLTVEESTVRDKAIESTMAVADMMEQNQFRQQYAEMISRLATKEWFTARMSSCGLIASSLLRTSRETQDLFVQQFAALCRDDAPMVRRVAAQHLGTLLTNLIQGLGAEAISQGGVVESTVIPLYEELASNDQDSVRLQTAENCVAFGKAIGTLCSQSSESSNNNNIEDSNTLVKRILPLVIATIDDRSWRVRWTAASKFADVVAAFSDLSGAVDSLITAYEKLLQDPEAEVRTAATFNLAEVAHCKALVSATPSDSMDVVSSDDTTPQKQITVAERLVKRIASLTEDESEHVRAALATVATELAPIVGKDATIAQIVPPVLNLLRDSASEVRLNLISSLSSLNEVIGVDLLTQTLIGAIEDLAKDPKWRTRLSIIQHIPLLAKQMGKEFFSEKLSSLSVGWLGDPISTIRLAAANNLKELTLIFGAEWSTVYLVPSIVELRRHQSYLHRLTAVQACALLSTAMTSEVARTWLLPMVLEMASDNVPNIRFNVAKALETMAPVCGKNVSDEQIRPVLSLLAEDSDRDVRFFAVKSLEAIEKEFGTLKHS